jgi:hypothetical protein
LIYYCCNWKATMRPLSIVKVQNVMYCLYFFGCPNILIHFGLKILTIWRFFVAVNKINVCSLKLPLYTRIYIYRFSLYLTQKTVSFHQKEHSPHVCSDGSIRCYLWRMNHLFMYKIGNVINTENPAMEMQNVFFCTVALHVTVNSGFKVISCRWEE